MQVLSWFSIRVLVNNEAAYLQELYLKTYSTLRQCILFPLLVLFHSSKPWWKYFFVREFPSTGTGFLCGKFNLRKQGKIPRVLNQTSTAYVQELEFLQSLSSTTTVVSYEVLSTHCRNFKVVSLILCNLFSYSVITLVTVCAVGRWLSSVPPQCPLGRLLRVQCRYLIVIPHTVLKALLSVPISTSLSQAQ